ncbi:type II secretion system protein G precursor [Desulfosporosinus acididurans]|uniref:Type II secretion system protein G n=2 Tax=Desulfosporosinus acididurans TaxID=476652 RepID=A0A0J1FS13_9FIRM|nr:type II secretion system protein G precursor [Desulfosporosinus acididurans]
MKPMKPMNDFQRENGFTLIEVMAVIIIMGIIAAVIIPKMTSSTALARKKADVATAHQVKAALDRFQVENGVYPKPGELTADTNGEVTCSELIPKYIGKLDKTTTQQTVADGNKGFGVAQLTADDSDKSHYSIPEPGDKGDIKTIMIYLSSDGLAAEVRAYDDDLKTVLWTSSN